METIAMEMIAMEMIAMEMIAMEIAVRRGESGGTVGGLAVSERLTLT